MQYLLLIYESEAVGAGRDPEARRKLTSDYVAFTEDIKAKGNSSPVTLEPVSTATTVRVREGKTLTTDGPFAETKEQLGGYYLIEAKDLDEALAIAARIPSAKMGSIEVRPIMVWQS